jgi:hypothetical protein
VRGRDGFLPGVARRRTATFIAPSNRSIASGTSSISSSRSGCFSAIIGPWKGLKMATVRRWPSWLRAPQVGGAAEGTPFACHDTAGPSIQPIDRRPGWCHLPSQTDEKRSADQQPGYDYRGGHTHRVNMAWREAIGNPMSRGADFRLTHYPSIASGRGIIRSSLRSLGQRQMPKGGQPLLRSLGFAKRNLYCRGCRLQAWTGARPIRLGSAPTLRSLLAYF